MNTYRVTKNVVTTTDYEVRAETEAKAEDAVYWRDSSQRPTGDAIKGESRTKVEYVVEKIRPLDKWCECGHHKSEHTEDGSCGWAGCVAYGAACVTDEARKTYFEPHEVPAREIPS